MNHLLRSNRTQRHEQMNKCGNEEQTDPSSHMHAKRAHVALLPFITPTPLVTPINPIFRGEITNDGLENPVLKQKKMVENSPFSGSVPSENSNPSTPPSKPDSGVASLVLQLLRHRHPELTEKKLTAVIERLAVLSSPPTPPPLVASVLTAPPTPAPTPETGKACDFTTLRQAMREAREYHQGRPTPMLLKNAVELFITTKKNKGKADKTLQYYDLLKRFARWSGEDCWLENSDPMEWLAAQTQLHDQDSVKAYYINCNAFFKWCVRRKFCPVNPCPRLRFGKAAKVKITSFPLGDMAKLFETAIIWRPSFIPILALHFFAGLRPSRETFELLWTDIDWEKKIINLPKGYAKNRLGRPVPMSPALIAWLEPFCPHFRRGVRIAPITYVDWKKRRPYLLRLAGVAWPGADAPRHTAASAWLEWRRDREAAAKLLGHSLDVQHNRYEFHSWEGWGHAYHHFVSPRGWIPNPDFDAGTQRGRQVPPPEELVMLGVPTARAWDHFRNQLQPPTIHTQ